MEVRYRFEVPPELRKFNRRKVEDAIEKLIMLLDLTAPDDDLEEDQDREDVDDDCAVDDFPCDEYEQDMEEDHRDRGLTA